MENIEGETIDKYLLWQSNDVFENIFVQLIEGFEYLENNNVLHRDIRNANILVTNDGIVKIIDFGFGKKIEFKSNDEASILLNWPVSEFPEEIYEHQYNHQTEIYFVGKLFNKILEDNCIEDFKYQHIVDNMMVTTAKSRVKSFSNVIESLSKDIFEELDFTDNEKAIYSVFAEELISHISYINKELIPRMEPKEVISLLENLINGSLMEDILQDNSRLIKCFISNGYNYFTTKDISIKTIRNFYKFFKKLSQIKKKIVLNNIFTRFNLVTIQDYKDDDIPF